jgi:nitrite reductase (NO-forming)
MDFHPSPAVVRNDHPHTGPYWSGSAISPGPEVPALDPSPVKTLQLDVVDRIIDLAPGIKYHAWTFGGQVPGPIIHCRQGDLIKFSMTNRSNETLPAAPELTSPMMHSMDFHAAMVSPDDKYRSIAPGQTIEFQFHVNYPGVFMYHCGTPMILEHLASGMYGMLIAEPRHAYPTKADKQYAIVQSEFYIKPTEKKVKVDGVPVYALDGAKVRLKESTYTVFNGVYNGFVAHPLTARPGDRVRLYVLNAGPSNTSSFHVVGTIFDRVWEDGNPDNQTRGRQTVLLGSSCATIVEFKVAEKGKYVMVDHHFANASQGALGVIEAAEGPSPSGPIEHHNIPVSNVPTEALAARGKMIYEQKCYACHSIGKGVLIGPDLYGVTHRHPDKWTDDWLTSPDNMLATDKTARELRARFTIQMPNQGLTAQDRQAMIHFFHWIDSQPQPGPEKPPPAQSPGPAGP